MSRSSFINDIYLLFNDKKIDTDKGVISILELLKKDREFYEKYVNFMKYANYYIKNSSNFILFYFNEQGDVVIHLGYDKDNKKRELVLKYDNNGYVILNKDILTDDEVIYFNSNIDFYFCLVKMGKERQDMCKKINTIYNNFNVDLFYKSIKLSYSDGNNYIHINYYFYQDIILDRIERYRLLNESFYDTSEGVFEIDTNVYRIKKKLCENNNENIIRLFDNLYVYVDELPYMFNNNKKKMLIKDN